MRHLEYILTLLLLAACEGPVQNLDVPTEVLVVYRDRPNETLADVAYDLLRFEKYEEALQLVQEDTSLGARTVKILANAALGNVRHAIDYAILDLRQQDSSIFYEGSWELCELYEIFKNDIDYGIKLLNDEYVRCSRNYQVRQLMMKLYWYLDDYETVVALGDEFRKELPDMSQEVTFNLWRQDALDSLAVSSPDIFNKIQASYAPKPWNGVEIGNN